MNHYRDTLFFLQDSYRVRVRVRVRGLESVCKGGGLGLGFVGQRVCLRGEGEGRGGGFDIKVNETRKF